MPQSSPATQPRRHRTRQKFSWQTTVSLVVFAMLAVLGPLAFGAADRIVQTGLVLLLAVGVAFSPPARVTLGKRGRLLVVALLAILFIKEFGPQHWFGSVRWRPEAEETLGLSFPSSHHPEPSRAFDWMLVAVVAIVWLQWVRTLAADRKARVAMTWILFLAGVFIAVVCFAMSAYVNTGTAIFGLRHAPGWKGWGPFPNRNHTASFLAMAASAGAGCVAWGIVKRRKVAIGAGTVGIFLVSAAVLVSQSRGGLLAFGVGLVTFSGIVLWKHRDRRAVTGVLTGLAAVAVCVAAFGTQVIERLRSDEAAHMSNQLRIDIWRNALAMWKDAPLFGHGVETFTWLFPFYQDLKLDDNVVLHPESSWLQWLTELGIIPLGLIGIAFGSLVNSGMRGVFERKSSFFLAAGAFGGCAAILVHGLIDVPAHRWGTAGYALALLGLACPAALSRGSMRLVSRGIGVVPLGIGAFWILPFLGKGPYWEPVVPALLRAREFSDGGKRPTLAEWKQALRYFPLERDLHHFAAMRELEAGPPKTSEWQRHFEIVQRLTPGGWRYPITHAKAVKPFSPALCIQYWQVAIERSGWRGTEKLGDAFRETSELPLANSLWGDYIARNPKFALAYAKLLPGDERRPFFDLWWKGRGQFGKGSEDEVADFYRFAPGWATGEQIDQWIQRHPKRRQQDYRVWVSLLHGTGRDEQAWGLYHEFVTEPPYPPGSSEVTIQDLEAQVRLAPENTTHLVALAQAVEKGGNSARVREIVLAAAAKGTAPTWFLRKGAYLLAGDGQYREAVEMALRENLELAPREGN